MVDVEGTNGQTNGDSHHRRRHCRVCRWLFSFYDKSRVFTLVEKIFFSSGRGSTLLFTFEYKQQLR